MSEKVHKRIRQAVRNTFGASIVSYADKQEQRFKNAIIKAPNPVLNLDGTEKESVDLKYPVTLPIRLKHDSFKHHVKAIKKMSYTI